MTIENIEKIINKYTRLVEGCAMDYIAGPISIEFGEDKIKERDKAKIKLIRAIKKYGAKNDS